MDVDFLLVQRMKNGDEAALEQFVRKYYPRILSYCRCHTYSNELADDLTQETFEHFFKSLQSYRHSGRLANYLYVIAGNLCRDSYKAERELPLDELTADGIPPGAAAGAEDAIAAAEYRLDIEAAVKRLPDELREVIILHFFQNLKLRETADIIGIGLPLVKYRLKKAKELLRNYIGEGVL